MQHKIKCNCLDFWTSEASQRCMASLLESPRSASAAIQKPAPAAIRQTPMVMHNPLAFGLPNNKSKPAEYIHDDNSPDQFSMPRSISSIGPEQFFKRATGTDQQMSLGRWLKQSTPMVQFDTNGDPVRQKPKRAASMMRKTSSTNYAADFFPIENLRNESKNQEEPLNSCIENTNRHGILVILHSNKMILYYFEI